MSKTAAILADIADLRTSLSEALERLRDTVGQTRTIVAKLAVPPAPKQKLKRPSDHPEQGTAARGSWA